MSKLQEVIEAVSDTLSEESMIYILGRAAAIASIMTDGDFDYIDMYINRAHPDFQASIELYLKSIQEKLDDKHRERLIAAGWIE